MKRNRGLKSDKKSRNKDRQLLIVVISAITVMVSLAIIFIIAGSDTLSPGQTPEQKIEFLYPQEASELIQDNPDFVIIDDRQESTFNKGHIANAINIEYSGNIRQELDKLDRNGAYLVYCATGCGATSEIMRELGFQEVYVIKGGLNEWISQEFPIEQ